MKSVAYILLGLVLTLGTAVAQTPGWFIVASSSDGNDVYSLKLHSGKRLVTKGGQPNTLVVGKVEHKLQQKVDIVKWYVTDADCRQGYGNIVELDMYGNVLLTAPFAKGGGSVGSAVASFICAVTANYFAKQHATGLSS